MRRLAFILPALLVATSVTAAEPTSIAFPITLTDPVAEKKVSLKPDGSLLHLGDARGHAHHQPGDVIVHSNKLTFLPTHYYDRSLPQDFVADEPGSPSDTLAYPTQQALGLFATSDIATATLGHEQ